MSRFLVIKLVFFFLLIFSCRQVTQNPQIVLGEYLEPGMLNPVSYTDIESGLVMKNIFQPLLSLDFHSLQPVPVLATKRPEIKMLPDGKIEIAYALRKEARWDDGTPITAKDVEFSLKLRKAPLVHNLRLKSNYEFIENIIYHPEDPKKFSIIGREWYMLAEIASGDISILPQKIYDPENLLDQFSLKELVENYEELSMHPALQKFAAEFNSEKYKKDPAFISGSGAYTLESWEPGTHLVLKRKENWWGNKLSKESLYFQAVPEKLVYRFISDPSTALVALKAGQVDVLRNIKSNEFIDLPNSEKFKASFASFTPDQMECHYIGFNHANPKLQDRHTRQAIAHLLDVDKVIKVVHFGMARRMVGPIHPLRLKDYASEIEPYPLDLGKARELLALGGWEDSNNNGILDKAINGQQTELELVYNYTAGSDERKYIGLILQEAASKAGIRIKLEPVESLALMEKIRNASYDIFYGAFGLSPVAMDFKQIFHSESCQTGSNYFGYKSHAADSLIDAIRVELDEEKRSGLYKQFQQVMHEELPCVFLLSRFEKIAIHKRFKNAQTTVLRPGFWPASFSEED